MVVFLAWNTRHFMKINSEISQHDPDRGKKEPMFDREKESRLSLGRCGRSWSRRWVLDLWTPITPMALSWFAAIVDLNGKKNNSWLVDRPVQYGVWQWLWVHGSLTASFSMVYDSARFLISDVSGREEHTDRVLWHYIVVSVVGLECECFSQSESSRPALD